MSNIPPPNSFDPSNYGYSPYGAAIRESISSAEPWNQDGVGGYGDPYGAAQNSALQQYAYDRQLALQTLQNGNLDPQTRQTWEYYLNVTLADWFQKYGGAAASMEGTDLSGGMAAGAAYDNLPLGEMIWQDQTRAKWDGADAVTYQVNQQSDTRQQDFFQREVTLQIPYRGSVAKTELVADDSVQSAKMLRVTVSMPDGSSRVVHVHHVTDDSNIRILASDPENVQLDASLTSDPLASQVTVGDIHSAAVSQSMGDGPTRRIDGKLGWDGDSFDIYSTQDGKDKYISAAEGVTFHPFSRTEFWTVEWNKTAYVIRVYGNAQDAKNGDPKKSKETFFMDDMTHLKASFDMDPTHIIFKGELGKGGMDSNELNTVNPQAQKLSFATEDDSSLSDIQLPNDATPPDQVSGNPAIATWNSWKTVNVYAKDGYQDHVITAPGTVTLHGSSYADTFEIQSYDAGPPQKWILLVHKDGKLDAANTKKFTVNGGSDTQVILDVMDQSSLVKSDGSPEDDSTKLGSVQLQSGGLTSGGNEGVDTSNDTPPTDKEKDTWTYTPKDGKVDLNATFDHKENRIQVTGDVTIHIADNQTANLMKENGDYLLTVTDPKTKKQATYHIDGNAQSVNIDGNELNIAWDKDSMFDEKVKVQGKTVSTTKSASGYVSAVLSLGAGAIQDDALRPTLEDMSDGGYGRKLMDWTLKSTQDIASALKSGDWSKVSSDFSELDGETEFAIKSVYGETLFRALRGVLNLDGSGGEKKLKALFSQMPSDIRQKWVNTLKSNGSDLLKLKDSDFLSGTWMQVPEGSPHWTLQNSVDFINAIESSSRSLLAN